MQQVLGKLLTAFC